MRSPLRSSAYRLLLAGAELLMLHGRWPRAAVIGAGTAQVIAASWNDKSSYTRVIRTDQQMSVKQVADISLGTLPLRGEGCLCLDSGFATNSPFQITYYEIVRVAQQKIIQLLLQFEKKSKLGALLHNRNFSGACPRLHLQLNKILHPLKKLRPRPHISGINFTIKWLRKTSDVQSSVINRKKTVIFYMSDNMLFHISIYQSMRCLYSRWG